ncbi:MAG: hypothetical protein ABEJ31_15775 [Haloarculaceae archaeon]
MRPIGTRWAPRPAGARPTRGAASDPELVTERVKDAASNAVNRDLALLT